jgi:hypothetical protein
VSSIPFRTSRHQVIFWLDSISRQAWIKAAEICEFIVQENGGYIDVPPSDVRTLEDKYWNLYEALAYCPIDRDGFIDLALLSVCTFPGFNSLSRPGLFSVYENHGRNLGIYISSIRKDKQIPEQLAELVAFAKNSIQLGSGGSVPANILPHSTDSSIGGFLHRQFFKTTRELYPLDLGDETEFLHHLCLPFMLFNNPEADEPFTDLEEALHYLRNFVRSY